MATTITTEPEERQHRLRMALVTVLLAASVLGLVGPATQRASAQTLTISGGGSESHNADAYCFNPYGQMKVRSLVGGPAGQQVYSRIWVYRNNRNGTVTWFKPTNRASKITSTREGAFSLNSAVHEVTFNLPRKWSDGQPIVYGTFVRLWRLKGGQYRWASDRYGGDQYFQYMHGSYTSRGAGCVL
jgi:hypothetical protein